MNAKKVTIPARDSNGFMIGFKEVNALWECPTCGGENEESSADATC
ncbi:MULTISPECIES: hypothetical protein [Bacillus amyloliquefaciens group]|nr:MULTISPECIES: hypothetical protein [Bacillus amyloliquefaciens group]MCJ2174080.1 hypothetical protein [Bacillus amyloliquefaciens]MCR4351942.1 hypothetical protein [Bacillus amyloliquefaciens]MCR4356843.1 hypothetical protein [Bacillus amyloliquefaciens]QHM79215.1 hypothetical protein DBK22_01052 [Bacillus velezensis]